ncbi:MAG: hypothetical protein HZA51_16500 [Planctomycetes bacterium]|nr:hypothetical protein [Planctomycetota bacterium]
MNASLKNSIATFKAQAAADPKKSAVLGILFCILLVICGKQFLGKGGSESTAPATAAAAPAPVAQAQKPVSQTPSISPTDVTPVPVDSTPAHDKAATAPPPKPSKTAVADDLPRKPARDLFTLQNWSAYAPTFGVADSTAKGAPRSEFWSNIAKAADEYRDARRQEAQALAKDLAELKLQSTLTGANPSAYISGHLVHEGDTLSGFYVARIEERRVLLTKSSYTYVLAMP